MSIFNNCKNPLIAGENGQITTVFCVENRVIGVPDFLSNSAKIQSLLAAEKMICLFKIFT
jgi:hypothetical protein